MPYCYIQSCQGLHRATTERVVPCLGVRRTDPLTRRAIRLKATANTEQQAHIELGRLLKEASEGRTPESNATMAKLLDDPLGPLAGYRPGHLHVNRDCLDEIRAELAAVGVELRDDAYLFSNDPAHSRLWNPDWATQKVAAAAAAAGMKLDIKRGRHYTASQLLAGGFDLRNTAARLGHGVLGHALGLSS